MGLLRREKEVRRSAAREQSLRLPPRSGLRAPAPRPRSGVGAAESPPAFRGCPGAGRSLQAHRPAPRSLLGACKRTPLQRGPRAREGPGRRRDAVKLPQGRTPGPVSGSRFQEDLHLNHGSRRSETLTPTEAEVVPQRHAFLFPANHLQHPY